MYQVVSAGSEPALYHWSIGGTLVSKVAASAPSIFAIAYNAAPRVLATGGYASTVDVFTDFNARAFTLRT